MWEEHGIEGRPHFKSLLYNEPAQTLIAHFERHFGHWAGEIYTRSLDATTYRKVPNATKLVSYHRPVSAASAPLIFFNELHHRAEDPSGADWGCVRALDLLSGEMREVTAAGTIQVPDGCAGVWISDILSADVEGQRLLCSVAFEQRVGERESETEYWLCELPVQTPIPQKISKLHNTFF